MTEQPKRKSNRGGKRIPGPGKKLGRPSGINRIPITVKLPAYIVDWLQGHKNQSRLIEQALIEKFNLKKPE